MDDPSTTSLATTSGDILHGAEGIAKFLYGDEKWRRKVYNLIATRRLPHFRLGSMICARKSVLLAWITAQEAFAGPSKNPALSNPRPPPSYPVGRSILATLIRH
jgi:hypothetical protein